MVYQKGPNKTDNFRSVISSLNQRPMTQASKSMAASLYFTSPRKSTWKISKEHKEDDFYVPGQKKYKPERSLKNLLREHSELKSHNTKNWLKKKVQFNQFKESENTEEEASRPQVKP